MAKRAANILAAGASVTTASPTEISSLHSHITGTTLAQLGANVCAMVNQDVVFLPDMGCKAATVSMPGSSTRAIFRRRERVPQTTPQPSTSTEH